MHGLRTNGASGSTKNNILRLILPKALEPIRTQLGIAHRVRDVFVSEVLLDRARVLALAGELESTGMPEHVRMDREGQFRELAGARNQFSRRRRRHRPFTLGHEHIRRVGIDAAQLPQCAQLDAADRVGRGEAILQSIDVNRAGLEINLLPAQAHELRDPKPMAVG
jgi:hypothetical protein